MDPLGYNYNYEVPVKASFSYDVKVEPTLNSSIVRNHSSTPTVPISMQNIPSSVRNLPNSTQNISNVSLNHPSNAQHSQKMQQAYDVPPTNVNNSLGIDNNSSPSQISTTMAPVATEQNTTEVEDSKEDLKPLLGRRKKKPTGRISNYWNKKISDTNFPFFGCSICNVSFTAIHELDQHVTIHKGRLTSYDLKLKNKRKRKLIKKQSKKLKKIVKKLKKEDKGTTDTIIIEIKPEDGYIGSEKATEYLGPNFENGTNNDTVCSNTDEKVNIDGKEETKESRDKRDVKLEPDDPRLQKLFKCFACQKQFSLGYYLKLHVRSHTDEKPYTCAQCGQSFITASKLGRHNKRIHLAIRYQCRICFRLFSRFEYLVRHFDKKHAEQKLEGEPYDYNAILPYLKELEEQLVQKVEAKEPKSETQDWGQEINSDAVPEWGHGIKQDDSSQDSQCLDVFLQPTMNVVIEEDEKIEVKIEKEDSEYGEVKEESFHDAHDGVDGSFAKVTFKDESVSDDDEDYFPSNTWAAPAPEPPPEPARRRHRRGDYPVKCDHCDKVIKTPTYMKVHLRTHTGEKPFKCYICGRGFITSSKMHRHVLTHTDIVAEEETRLEADGIKEDPDKEANVEEADEGKSKRVKSSKKKKKVLQTIKAKKQYQRRPHACPFCSKRFLHTDTLMVHQKCHEGETRILKCNFCLEEQPDEGTLRTHEATHTGPKPFLCTVCSRGYKKRESMVYHRRSHLDESERKTFVCDICSKSFNEQCKLQRHLVSHRVDKFTLKYECPVCAHMFHTKYHVEMHLASHQKEGTISEHNRNEILAMVLQNARKIPKPGNELGNPPPDLTPRDERSTVCNICGEVFTHFYYLEEHLKSHGSKIAIEDFSKEEEKKHICPVCNKGFKLHYYLKLHSFTHSKEKPFICQQCGKGFITKGKLKRHLETHTGLKRYQCHICYKFFTRPSYMRIHVRTIHGTQDYNFRLERFGKQFDVYSESSG